MPPTSRPPPHNVRPLNCFMHRSLYRGARLIDDIIDLPRVTIVNKEEKADVVLYDGLQDPKHHSSKFLCFHRAHELSKLGSVDFKAPCSRCHKLGSSKNAIYIPSEDESTIRQLPSPRKAKPRPKNPYFNSHGPPMFSVTKSVHRPRDKDDVAPPQRNYPHPPIEISSDEEPTAVLRRPSRRGHFSKKRRIAEISPLPPPAPVQVVKVSNEPVECAADEEEEEEDHFFKPVIHIFMRHSVAPEWPRTCDDDDDETVEYAWHCWFLDFLDWCLQIDPFIKRAEVYKRMADATNNTKFRSEFAQMGYRLGPQVAAAFKRVRVYPGPNSEQDRLSDKAQDSSDKFVVDVPMGVDMADSKSDGKSDDDEEIIADEEMSLSHIMESGLRHRVVPAPNPENDSDCSLYDNPAPFSSVPSGSSLSVPTPAQQPVSQEDGEKRLSSEELLAYFQAFQEPLMTDDEIRHMGEAIAWRTDPSTLETVWRWMQLVHPERGYKDDNYSIEWRIAYDQHREEVESAATVARTKMLRR